MSEGSGGSVLAPLGVGARGTPASPLPGPGAKTSLDPDWGPAPALVLGVGAAGKERFSAPAPTQMKTGAAPRNRVWEFVLLVL